MFFFLCTGSFPFYKNRCVHYISICFPGVNSLTWFSRLFSNGSECLYLSFLFGSFCFSLLVSLFSFFFKKSTACCNAYCINISYWLEVPFMVEAECRPFFKLYDMPEQKEPFNPSIQQSLGSQLLCMFLIIWFRQPSPNIYN